MQSGQRKELSALGNKIKSLGRGFKVCGGCYGNVGVRTRICPTCKFQFPKPQPRVGFKRKKAKLERVNWRELKKGEVVRVYNNGGTILEGEETSHSIPRNGIYTVDKVLDNGFYGFLKKGGGRVFIFMGKETKNKAGFINKPHKIRRIADG